MKHLAIIIFASLLVLGCGASKELEKPKSSGNILKEYEDRFRPSDYDMDPKVFLSELRREKEKKSIPSEPAVSDPPLPTPGFRVQMLATTDIDEANGKKAEAEAAFAGEWFYIAFDAPTYKIRAGNFLVRDDADMYAKFLQENGFPDAWVVPEKVIRNIQPRPDPQREVPRQ